MYKPEDLDKEAYARHTRLIDEQRKAREKAIESRKPKGKIIRRGLSDTRRKKLSIRNRRRRNK